MDGLVLRVYDQIPVDRGLSNLTAKVDMEFFRNLENCLRHHDVRVRHVVARFPVRRLTQRLSMDRRRQVLGTRLAQNLCLAHLEDHWLVPLYDPDSQGLVLVDRVVDCFQLIPENFGPPMRHRGDPPDSHQKMKNADQVHVSGSLPWDVVELVCMDHLDAPMLSCAMNHPTYW